MRRALIGAVLLSAGTAAGQSLDAGMARIAEAVAPKLQEERNREGVSRAVDLFLFQPVDAMTDKACPALSETLWHRLAAAIQAGMPRGVAEVILTQQVGEGELALRLEWAARKAGSLELRPSYGRLRGATVVGTFILPVEIALADLSPAERACLAGAAPEAATPAQEERIAGYRARAEAGDPVAMFNLAVRYANGSGVARDHAEALGWYRRAAEAGLVDAMSNLGLMYERGEGVAADHAEAVRWYRRAAEGGSVAGMINLALMYRAGAGVAEDRAEAVRWYRAAAEAGDPKGMSLLAMALNGGDGVAKDTPAALGWYRRAAEQGFADAMVNLGVMYQRGEGVAADDAEALRWYRWAAESGSPAGMVNLAMMHERGLGGLAVDRESAVRWYREAARAGHGVAKERLRRLGAE